MNNNKTIWVTPPMVPHGREAQLTFGKRYEAIPNVKDEHYSIVLDSGDSKLITLTNSTFIDARDWIVDGHYGKTDETILLPDPALTKEDAWKLLAKSRKCPKLGQYGVYLQDAYTKEDLLAILAVWDELPDA
jgi:hypothetical protein